MTREEARREIISRTRELLTPDRKGKGFLCPICGSGSKTHGTGITTKDGRHFTCWVGCFKNADIIDIIGLKYGLTDYDSKLQAAADALGIPIGEKKSPPRPRLRLRPANALNQKENGQDYTDFFLQANRNIHRTTYHRGLTMETINRFHLGYVENWTHPKAPHAPPSPRLIIPTGRYSYLARDTRETVPPKQAAYTKSKVGRVQIFNSGALYHSDRPVFVVEGEIDALSVIDVGGEAVALGSTANKDALLSLLKNRRPSQPLILALDNDEAGRKTDLALSEGLESLKIPFFRLDITGPCKDANEALIADRDAFQAMVAQGASPELLKSLSQEKEDQAEEEKLQAERESLRKKSAAYAARDFLRKAEKDGQTFFPTGFPFLDQVLNGGLYPGLYVVGAVTALGKSTFCLQVADSIAQAGQDVLVFSLEMAQSELIAKTISRLTYIRSLEKAGNSSLAKTTRELLARSRYAAYSQEERELIQGAVDDYLRYAGRLYIVEGVGDVGVDEIRSQVQQHCRLTGTAPVVVIDYLQILAPADIRATDKQNTDKAVLELKRLSRDYNVPVLGVSSFNRDNYSAPVGLSSFKESGAIEYSSDVLIGMQLQGMDWQEGEAEKSREKRVRELMKKAMGDAGMGKPQKIQLKVLKQRHGSRGDVVLDFYPMFNYFSERAEAEEAEKNQWRRSGSLYPDGSPGGSVLTEVAGPVDLPF